MDITKININNLQEIESINDEDYIIIETQNSTRKSKASLLTHDKNTINESVSNLKSQVTDLDGAVVASQLEVDNISEQASTIQTNMTSMQTDMSNIKTSINTVNTQIANKVDSKYVKLYPITAEEINSIAITGVNVLSINLAYEYGHVNRYGAKELGKDEFNALYNKTATEDQLEEWDSSKAIQTAILVVEKLATNRKGIYPIRFNGGTYLVTHTIICKACEDKNGYEVGDAANPLSFIGVERKTVSSKWSSGTIIIPWIKSTNYIQRFNDETAKYELTTDGYANLFAINIKYKKKNEYTAPTTDYKYEMGKPYTDLTDTDLYDSNVTYHRAGINATICNNIAFKNLSIYLDNNVADNYNINVIKAYRTRFTIDNVYVHNMRQFMLQPAQDATGGTSYCDFSQYTNLNLSRIKYRGLELYNADNSKIEDITNHFPGKDFDSLILIRGGGAITISRIHFAYSFDLDIYTNEKKLVPKQLGTGIKGTKAYIKIANTREVSINGIYSERQLLDYMFYLYNVKNIHIENTTEAFFGNGFISIAKDSANISINNVYRRCNLVSDYLDIYFGEGVDVNNVHVSNFMAEDWYDIPEDNPLTLATDQSRYSNLIQLENKVKKRSITSNKLNISKSNNFSLETMSFKIMTVNNKLAILNYTNDLSSDIDTATATYAKNEYFSITWNGDEIGGFLIESVKDSCFCLRSVQAAYSTINTMYLPVSSSNADRYRIAMWDTKNNKFTTTFSPNMSFIVNIEALRI